MMHKFDIRQSLPWLLPPIILTHRLLRGCLLPYLIVDFKSLFGHHLIAALKSVGQWDLENGADN